MDKDCIFCKIVSGEIPSYKFWQDDKHLAFLSIFPNTEGFSVVAAKEHLPSYSFENRDEILSALVIASKKAAKILDASFGDVARTGMFLEGMGVDHLHSKLFPMHGTKGKVSKELVAGRDRRDFLKKYPGYLSSHDSERADDKELVELVRKLQETAKKLDL